MHYQLFHNEDAGFMRAYEPGDHLATGYKGSFPACFSPRNDIPFPELMMRLAERVFTIHNRDDRPDGQTAPSLSVGDVIVIGEVALTVDRVGMKIISVPSAALIEDILNEYLP